MGEQNVSKFSCILQRDIRPDDKQWSYTVPHLPLASTTNRLRLIKSVSIVSSQCKQEVTLRFQQQPPNRAIESEILDRFISITFEKFRLQYPQIDLHNGTSSGSSQQAPPKESADYILRLLSSGLSLNDIQYRFYGHSNSQLKSKTCFLYAGSKEEICDKIDALGDFSKIKSVAKLAKRIGLLFSAAEAATQLRPDRCEDIPDIFQGEHIFTDGCGLISRHMARLLVQKLNIRFRNKRYNPSVFQIRYRGYKGVLELEPKLQGQTLVQFRDSMRKISGTPDLTFSVVEYSKPYSFGYLNDEVILLLRALGIPDSIFLRKQQEHLDFLSAAVQDPREAFRFLSYANEPHTAETMLLEGLDSVKATVRRQVNAEYGKMLNKRDEQRCRIFIHQSRLIFGVCDPRNVLKDGECALRVTMDGDGAPRTIVGTEVLVTRNPCLHPGDIQKFKAVQYDELSHLVDCIVFPTQGRRPSADLMSGGDLDGDKFFVCWDPDLIPSKLSQAANYQGANEPITFGKITYDDRVKYFAGYTNASLGRVKSLFMDWARLKGPMSSECQELNHLFSRCVDGNRIKVPPRLQEPPRPNASNPAFILDTLHEAAKPVVLSSHSGTTLDGLSVAGIEIILSRDRFAFSEFELFKMTAQWCIRNGAALQDLLHYFDFNQMSDEQKDWVIGQSDPQKGWVVGQSDQQKGWVVGQSDEQKDWVIGQSDPQKGWVVGQSDEQKDWVIGRSDQQKDWVVGQSNKQKNWVIGQISADARMRSSVQNALSSSCLLSPEELRYFRLDDPAVRWKRIFDSTIDRMARFMETAGKALELFHRKLIIIRVDTRLTIAIYVPRRLVKYQECLVDDAVRLFSFPHSQQDMATHRRSLTTKVDYRLYFDDGGFQLYETKRANTWVFLTKPGSNDASYKAIEGIGQRRRARDATLEQGTNHDWVISIAVNKFSANLAKHVGRINRNPVVGVEIYVISNRDTRTLQVLDQWLSLIDTKEIMPLFDTSEREYALPTMEDVDWSSTPAFICEIGRDARYANLELVQTPAVLVTLLEWLLSHGQRARLRKVFEYLLSSLMDSNRQNLEACMLDAMVDFLRKQPPLVISFALLGSWAQLPMPLQKVLKERAVDLLKAIIAAANDMQILIVKPFEYILTQMTDMSFFTFSSLAENISLMVRSSEIALDLLMGCLQPHGARLLTARSEDVHYFMKNCIGIAIEHIDEANKSESVREDLLNLTLDSETGLVRSHVRIDSHTSIRFSANDHIQLTPSSPPTNSIELNLGSVDTLVEAAEPGSVSFQFLHPLPSFLESCSWRVKHCGSLATSRAMFEALNNFVTDPGKFCVIHHRLMAVNDGVSVDEIDQEASPVQNCDLNQSQKDAVTAAMHSPLTCLWGPPGTGKTYTLAVILELLSSAPDRRILVTAPAHNAVDNIMRKYMGNAELTKNGTCSALRVSTDVRKVAEDLRKYTCDAMFGKDLNENPAGRKKAQKQIRQSRLIFTTCIGAGLGLLRSESFDTVVIDEASQQTEPLSLVPLTKGCSKAVLVGDHVQLRATVIKHAKLVGFEMSLFERLYSSPDNNTCLRKVMLDTQYRMQTSICAFSSAEFYEGRLKTAVQDSKRPLNPPSFPWPCEQNGKLTRMFFIQCPATEDLGDKSKSNHGQAVLARQVCKMLQPQPNGIDPPMVPSVAVLAPYSRQVEKMSDLRTSGVTVNSIDGFQGREADIVVFVTTRCNVHGKIGFLEDMRRLNVVLTRARCACIIIGDAATLTGGDPSDEATRIWKRLLDSLTPLTLVRQRTPLRAI